MSEKLEIKKIEIKDFRESGYLQEANRRFFHPLGLALEVSIDEEGKESISGVWDYRDDKEGIHYDIQNSDVERKERFLKNKNFIDSQLKERGDLRKSELGFKIEPIDGSPDIMDDRMLALAADFDNYKKRVQKEKEELVTNTKVKMLTSILDMDNDLSIALKNTEDEGVKLIANKLTNFLKSQGIEEIQTDSYDEDLHEVISILEVGESKIIDVIGKGYTLNGKPFRYPKIILGK
jgi:molecular chaperone GrpE